MTKIQFLENAVADMDRAADNARAEGRATFGAEFADEAKALREQLAKEYDRAIASLRTAAREKRRSGHRVIAETFDDQADQLAIKLRNLTNQTKAAS